MLGFKQFITEQAQPVEQGRLGPDGVPCAFIHWQRPTSADPAEVPAAYTGGFPRKVHEKAPASPVFKSHKPFGGGHEGDLSDWHEEYDNHHIGHGGEVHEHLVSADKSSEKDKEHIGDYTRDSSRLNRHLYNSHVDGVKHSESVGHFNVKEMDKTIGKNKLKHDLHTYSGVTWHPGEVAAKHPDRHVHLPAYTSTSLDKEVAHSFATGDHNEDKHVIHFHLKAGQKGKYAEHLSENPGEHEFIMPRNTTIKVHPHPDVYEDHYSGEKTHVWHAHVVDGK